MSVERFVSGSLIDCPIHFGNFARCQQPKSAFAPPPERPTHLVSFCESLQTIKSVSSRRREERTNLVGENHQSIIRLSSQYSSDTLRSMTHRVERKKVVLPDTVRVSKELQSSLLRKSSAKIRASGSRRLTLRIRLSVY